MGSLPKETTMLKDLLLEYKILPSPAVSAQEKPFSKALSSLHWQEATQEASPRGAEVFPGRGKLRECQGWCFICKLQTPETAECILDPSTGAGSLHCYCQDSLLRAGLLEYFGVPFFHFNLALDQVFGDARSILERENGLALAMDPLQGAG